jgi:ParB-like nuclease domain
MTQIPATLRKLAVDIDSLKPYPGNARRGDLDVIQASLRLHGQYRAIVVQKSTRYILAGNHTWMSAKAEGWKKIAATFVDVDDIEARRINLIDNRAADLGDYDLGALADQLSSLPDLDGTGYGQEAMDRLLEDVGAQDPADESRARGALLDDYVVPPYTVLDRRQGYWQDRRRAWLDLGIASEIGRDEHLAFPLDKDYYEKRGMWGGTGLNAGTSVFDPVLCELMYRWFCPAGGVVLDPFAGGSVRGIVAAALGRHYCGIELQDVQVEANRAQARDILTTSVIPEALPLPRWIAGDSAAVLIAPEKHELPRADLVFTCPPYGSTEVYSDDPRDLSRMTPGAFDETYAQILSRTVARLVDDRFAVVVIGNVRDRRGRVRDLGRLTIDAMAAVGADFYNDAVLLAPPAAAAIRVERQFGKSRKLVRVHQSVLVFVKGSPQTATAAIVDGDDPQPFVGPGPR